MSRIKIIPILFLFLIASLSRSFCQDKDRDSWQKPSVIMDTIGVKEGMVIGEAGAGEGYFTFKLSKRVGEKGKIYANDINEKALRVIQQRCEREGIANIITVLGKEDDPLFPAGEMDMVVMMLAFHEFKNKLKWLENVKRSLKPTASLVIIERDPDRWGQGHSHFMTKKAVLDTVAKANYELVRVEMFLPRDNIYIYRLPQHTEKESKN